MKRIRSAFIVLMLGQALTQLQAGYVDVTWASQNPVSALGDAGGKELPAGSLVRLGVFELEPEQIAEDLGNLGLLESRFTELTREHIGQFGGKHVVSGSGSIDGVSGLFSAGFAQSTSFEISGLEGRRLYIWAFNAESPALATQYGIFSAPSWTVPERSPAILQLGLEQLNSKDTTNVYLGTRGPESSTTLGGSLNKLLSPIPAVPVDVNVSVSGRDQLRLDWADAAFNETGFRVERSADQVHWEEIAELPADSKDYLDSGLDVGTTYAYRIQALGEGSDSRFSEPVALTTPYQTRPQSIPINLLEAPFTQSDIGFGHPYESVNYDLQNGVLRMEVAGGNTRGKSDDLNYRSREMTGDFQVTVKVDSVVTDSEKGYAGIMLRGSKYSNSQYVLVAASDRGVSFVRRRSKGEGIISSGKSRPMDSVWLRLRKNGNRFLSYHSEDGDSWALLAEDEIEFPSSVLVGLAAASNDGENELSVEFSDFEIKEKQNAPMNRTFTGVDIGFVGLNGDEAYDFKSDTFLVQAAGGGTRSIQDALRYVYREQEGDFETVVKIKSLIGQSSLSQAGLMLRNSLAPDADCFSLMVTRHQGMLSIARADTVRVLSGSILEAASAPIWLKLTKTGSVVESRYSNDGDTWTLVERATWNPLGPLLIGMATGSGSESSLAFAEFTAFAVSE